MDRHAPTVVLRDLVAEESLGLELLTGGEESLDRPVLGAAVVEVEAPTSWLEEQWVLLTAGVGLGTDAAGACRALVRECVKAGTAALGFGIGPVFDPLPDALIEEGAACGFPIFSVPRTTPFRDVVSFVDTSLAAGEAPLYRRLSSLQRFVVDALLDPEPEQAVVERLARFLDASVLVLSPTGEAELAVGKAPAAALGAAVRDAAPAPLECDVEGWHAALAPVAGPTSEGSRWLAVAVRHGGFAQRLARPAAETTAPLLGAMARLQEVVLTQEAAARGALLEELLDPADPRDVPALAARAASFGLDFAAPARVVVVRAEDAGAVPVLAHELAEALGRAGAAYLLSRRAACAVALVQAADGGLGAALEELTGAQPDAVAGVGRPVADAAAACHSLRDAELAVEPGADHAGRRIVAFEDFDLHTLLLSEARPEWLEPKVADIVSVLRSRPTMHEALKCWFEHDLDTAAAAAALHLHPNSLRYRLARLEEALGRTLRRPSTITDLHIALLVEEAGERRAAKPEPR